MNITVEKADKTEFRFYEGGYAVANVAIKVDTELPLEYQQSAVIHETIELYCPFLDHDKVVELTGYILDGLSQLNELNKEE